MKIRWMPLAEQGLDAAYEHVRKDNPKAASQLVERVLQAVEMLSRYPSAGHAGRVPTTRGLTISRTPYIVAYRHTQDEIQILAVIHGAREIERIAERPTLEELKERLAILSPVHPRVPPARIIREERDRR